MAQDSNVRKIARIVGVVTIATALGACGLISGLSSYSTGQCSEDCDGGKRPQDASHVSTNDGAFDTGTTMMEASEDASDGGEDAEAGCPGNEIECADAGCVDPSMVGNCGSCGNICGADADLCAAEDGGFACTTTCPDAAPLNCGMSCVDPTSNPNYCGGCDAGCSTNVPNAQPTCVSSTCGFACETNYTLCAGACVDVQTDNNNCGNCASSGGATCTGGSTCVEGMCQAPAVEAGVDAAPEASTDSGMAQLDAAVDAGPPPCPAGGCPTSTASGYTSCPFGKCNGNPTCTAGGPCVCGADSQCNSGKCVEVSGENDQSCAAGSGCSGSGVHDGFNCELTSTGIPVPSGTTTYSCPADSGFGTTTLTCQGSHANCYCTANNQCPSGKCVPNAANNNNCSGCTGTGTPDYRGCQPPSTPSSGTCYVYCAVGQCSTFLGGNCVCNNDDQCESGKCVCSGSNCSGSGTAQTNGCVAPPSSIACTTSGGTACTTSLTPTPVLNSAKTACLCVADTDCASGKCVNVNSQCTGTCTGSGTADSQDCETATSTADAWSCSAGNCDTVSSPTGTCTATGVPCWCTSNSQCGSGALCASWNGCASGACTGTGTSLNAFHCVP